MRFSRISFAQSLLGVAVLPLPVFAQGVSVGASRWLSSPHVSEYRLGMDGFGFGPFSYRPQIQFLRQGADSGSSGTWGGAGADLILRATRDARPYLIGGAGLGLARAPGGSLGPSVGAWGGVGAELVSFMGVALQAEATYTWRSRMDVQSISLGFRIGSKIAREHPSDRANTTLPPAAMPGSSAADEAVLRSVTTASPTNPAPVSGVVGTALSAMGTPYLWGGNGPEGFDCSGLIQYTYAQHGVSLPRTSAEQAKAGRAVERRLDALVPGDILTFSSDPGGDVSHVGLYLGEGRFIHSANGGVQTSLLKADDPAGGWWFARWVGARRVIEQ